MHFVDYLKWSVNNFYDIISKNCGACLKQYIKGKSPHPQYYRPEPDTTNELDSDGISRYHKFIGTLIWAIELGRIDMNMEVGCILQQLCSPREGNLYAVYHIFRYLKVHLKDNPGRILFYGTLKRSSESFFELGTQDKEEWNYFYPDS